MLLTHCQKDNGIHPEPLDQETKRSTTKTVSPDDIPEVINFIKSKSNNKMEFKLDNKSSSKNGMQRSNEDDLILTSVITDEIQQITNSYDKSSYTFKLIEQESFDGTHFLNLVVKEYLDTYYIIIFKYVPDPIWLLTYSNDSDIAGFIGTIYFYNSDGPYKGKAEMIDGVSSTIEKTSCSEDSTDSSGGGGSTGDGSGTGDGSTSSSGDSDGGGGGGSDYGTCTWEIAIDSCVDHEPGGICGGKVTTLVLNCGDFFDEQMTIQSFMDCPEEQVETCYQANGDPCTTGCDEFGNCIETTDQVENNEVIIMTDQEKLQFNKFITYSLSSEQQDWINDIENWLSRNAIFNYFKTNTYSTEAKAFVKEAIDANLKSPFKIDLLSLAPTQIDTSNVAENQKFMCVYNKLVSLPSFKNILNDVFENSETFDVKFEIVENLINPKSKPVNGLTIRLTDTSYKIQIDKSTIENHSLLFIAKVILHEAIHANLYARASVESNANLENEFINNTEYEYQESFLLNYYANVIFGVPNWQHNFMANELLTDLTIFLQDFHNLYPDSDFKAYLGEEYDWTTLYKDLTMAGSLQETNYYKTTYTNNLNIDITNRVNINITDTRDLSQSQNICD